MLQISPVTTHRVAMNGANAVVSSHHGAGETFQNDAESSRCDVKGARLEPDTIRVRNPETLIFQVEVGNEVFAAPSIRIETVGEIAEGSDRHMSPLHCQALEDACFFSDGAGAGRSEFQISTITFHVPSACFLKISTYLPRSLTGLPMASVIVSS